MPKRTPSYRLRKGHGQAIVTLSDSFTKKRRDYWLGEYGSPASREQYHRVIAEWEASGRRLPSQVVDRSLDTVPADWTISELIHRFWSWAKDFYQPTQAGTYKSALRLLRQYYGQTPAARFGPSKLRLLRDEMVRGDASADPPRMAWSRRYITRSASSVH